MATREAASALSASVTRAAAASVSGVRGRLNTSTRPSGLVSASRMSPASHMPSESSLASSDSPSGAQSSRSMSESSSAPAPAPGGGSSKSCSLAHGAAALELEEPGDELQGGRWRACEG